MTNASYTTRHMRRVYDGFLKVDLYEASLAKGSERITALREVHDHGHGATVLPVDAARRTALLVRQMRMPVHVAEGEGHLLEAAAGLSDPEDRDAAETARREAREELGYTIHDLIHVGTFYTIPGLVTERISAFLASYTPADRVEGDTGADADEVLSVEEWPLPDLWAALEDGRLRDAKTIICLQALRVRRPELFD